MELSQELPDRASSNNGLFELRGGFGGLVFMGAVVARLLVFL